MNHSIVVLGSVNADLVLRCSSLPLAGQTVHGSEFMTVIGGKGANQAVAAARLGGQVSFVGCVGDDDFGRLARERLAAEGIDIAHLHSLSGTATGVAMVLVESSGQNSIALAAGANAGLSCDHVEAAAGLIAEAGLLICQLESPLATVVHAMQLARRAGVPVLLNPAPAQALPPEVLAQVDILVPNETEAALLLGLDPSVPQDAVALAAQLRALGPRTVIVTLGAAGVQVADGGVQRHTSACVVSAVDSTGAGDAFIGAFAAARSQGQSVDAAVAWAQRAAALSVTRHGAMSAMAFAHELAQAEPVIKAA